MKNNQSRGFTLIELMIVVAIIGLLAVMGYPKLNAVLRHRALDTAAKGYARAVYHARISAMTQRQAVAVFVSNNAFYAQTKDAKTTFYRFPENSMTQIDSTISVTTSNWVLFDQTALLVDGNMTMCSYVTVILTDTVTKEIITVTINAVGAVDFARTNLAS